MIHNFSNNPTNNGKQNPICGLNIASNPLLSIQNIELVMSAQSYLAPNYFSYRTITNSMDNSF